MRVSKEVLGVTAELSFKKFYEKNMFTGA